MRTISIFDYTALYRTESIQRIDTDKKLLSSTQLYRTEMVYFPCMQLFPTDDQELLVLICEMPRADS